MNPDNKIVGANGWRMVTGTSTVSGHFFSFVANTDCVLNDITDKDGNSILSALAASGVTLSQGGYFPCPDAYGHYGSITLSSGDVIAYNK